MARYERNRDALVRGLSVAGIERVAPAEGARRLAAWGASAGAGTREGPGSRRR